MSYFSLLRSASFSLLLLFSSEVLCSTVINGTRVIYPSDSKEVSVKISNNGSSPVLIQSWIDNGDQNEKPTDIKVPFVLTPPMNRVDSGKGQTLRITYTGESLPMDRESVFWLNVLEVPAKNESKAQENTLQVAFRTRIKLFFRPAGLHGHANDAAKEVTWNINDSSVEANNPTPYYVNFVNLSMNGQKIDSAMVAPYKTLKIKLQGKSVSKISGAYVNDYGAVNAYTYSIK